ncbi:hypothetical protein QAD02_015309 [Eretmocerus hayati]|uniref:Uncharacterized protein n=1 Tax=Eretmocerus hayati TaxID=131215 RepID=A0ACC2P8A6_9HYME|nr:hypothetical protein QAD02_015309 [Eretmocerus hayati]
MAVTGCSAEGSVPIHAFSNTRRHVTLKSTKSSHLTSEFGIVPGYISMAENGSYEKVVICPYDKSHKISASRSTKHIWQCRQRQECATKDNFDAPPTMFQLDHCTKLVPIAKDEDHWREGLDSVPAGPPTRKADTLRGHFTKKILPVLHTAEFEYLTEEEKRKLKYN